MIRSSRLHSLLRDCHAGAYARRPISALFITSRRPTKLNCWKIIAQRRRQSRSFRPRRAVTSVSSHKTRPPVGSVSRLSRRNNVDLPAPERPTTPTNWPPGMLSDRLSTAHTRPKTLLIPSITSRGGSGVPTDCEEPMISMFSATASSIRCYPAGRLDKPGVLQNNDNRVCSVGDTCARYAIVRALGAAWRSRQREVCQRGEIGMPLSIRQLHPVLVGEIAG